MKQHELKRWCHTTLATGALTAGLLGAANAVAFSQTPPAPSPNLGEQQALDAVYGLAQGCYAVQSPQNGKYMRRFKKAAALVDDGLSYNFTANNIGEAAHFYFKPTSFSHYMLTDKDGRYLATHLPNEVSSGRYAGSFAEFKVTAHSGNNGEIHFSFYGPALKKVLQHNYGNIGAYRHGGLYVIDALNPANLNNETAFRLVPQNDCRPFPEAELNLVESQPYQTAVDQPVRGFIDPHTHITSYEFMGGKMLHGKPFHRFGIENALNDSKGVHGPQGALDIIGNLMGYDDVNHRYDTRGYPDFPFWPNHRQISHMQQYYKWIERAHKGGQRILVSHLVENEVLCNVQKTVNPASWINPNNCNTMASIYLQIQRLREMQDYIDAQQGGPGKGFFRIVTSPAQARQVIADGKLAVLMGIEASELFNCGLKDSHCNKESIERQLRDIYDAGVRVMYPLHRFDNKLGGARMEDGFINVGQRLSTGRFFETQGCDAETQGAKFVSGFPLIGKLPVLKDILNVIGLNPTYDESVFHCNRHGLSELGNYLVNRMIDKGMIIELDHTSTKTARSIMDIVESRNYSGVVSTHSHLNHAPGWRPHKLHQRIAEAGGFLARYNGSSNGIEGSLSPYLSLVEETEFLNAVAFSSDMGGIGPQAAPRNTADNSPLIYPFETEFGTRINKQKTGNRIFDYNTDGVAHYGLLADHLEDIRNQASRRVYDAIMNSAEAYLQMWERSVTNNSAKHMDPAASYVSIVDRRSGRCMDIPGDDNNVNNGVNVQLWDCQLTADDQKWLWDKSAHMFRNKANPDKCLDNRGQQHDGGEIVIWDCVDHNNLRWTYSGNRIANMHDGQFVADAFGSGNGANVGQWRYHGGENQQWELRLQHPEGRWAQFRVQSSGQCMTAPGGNNGDSVRLENCGNNDNQQWKYDPATGLVISKVRGTKCLDIPAGNTNDHARLQLWDCDANNKNQQFNFSDNLFRARLNTNQVVDAAGQELIMFRGHGNANQRWHGTLN